MTTKNNENKYAYIKDGKVFLKAYLDMPDRQIGEVKNTDEEALEYFENRFEIAKNKVEKLKTNIEEAQNKGSYLTKLRQLRIRLKNFDGIGDFIPLLNVLDEKEEYLSKLIIENQNNNYEIKTKILEEIKPISKGSDWEKSSDLLFEARKNWIKTGPVPREFEDSYNQQFKEYLDDFYQRRNAFYEEKNKKIDAAIKKYQELIDQAFELNRRDDIDEAYKDLKRIQAEWKTVGNVPAKIGKNQFQVFKKHTSHFYNKYCKIKGIKNEKKLDPRIISQMKMVEEAEKLSEDEDIIAAAEKTKMLLNSWKNIKVPSHLTDRNLAERFRAACDKIFELSYLNKVILRKYPTFKFLNDSQKAQTRYREMENIVQKARADMDELKSSFEYLKNQNIEIDRQSQSTLSTQNRKLLMKEVILEELKQKSKKDY